jgi:hypothetical protein
MPVARYVNAYGNGAASADEDVGKQFEATEQSHMKNNIFFHDKS